MAGFSNFASFGTGLLNGIQSASANKQAQQTKVDDDYRQAALKVSVENEIENNKQAAAQKAMYQQMQLLKAGNTASTNDATAQAQVPNVSSTPTPVPASQQVTGAQMQPPMDQTIDNSQSSPAPGPSQTTTPASTASAQPQQMAPSAGGMNSPQGSPVPLQQPQMQSPQQQPLQQATPTNIPAPDTGDGWVGSQERMTAAMAYSQQHKLTGAAVLGAYVAVDEKHRKDLAETNKANYDSEKTKLETTKLQNEISDKTVKIDDLGEQDQDHTKMMKNLGILGKNASVLHKPDSRAEASRDTAIYKAYDSYNAANAAITSYNSLLGLGDDVITGPMSELQAKVNAAIDKTVADGTYSSKVTNTYVAMKDSAQLANSTAKALGGMSRIGIGVLQFEKSANPSPEMPPEAMKTLVFQGLASSRYLANMSKAVISGPTQLEAADRMKVANSYAESNPPLMTDGATPNPEFKSFDEWRAEIASGKTSKRLNADQVRGAAIQGQQAPTQDQTQQQSAPKVIGTWNPKTGKIE